MAPDAQSPNGQPHPGHRHSSVPDLNTSPFWRSALPAIRLIRYFMDCSQTLLMAVAAGMSTGCDDFTLNHVDQVVLPES